jgi:hypothetical protein
VFRTSDWALVRQFDRPHRVGRLSFSPDGTKLVHQPGPEVGQLWDLEILDIQTGGATVLFNDDSFIRNASWMQVAQ